MFARLSHAAARAANQAPRFAAAAQHAGFKAQKFTPITVSFAQKQLPLFAARPLHSYAARAASSNETPNNATPKKKSPFDDMPVDASQVMALTNEAVTKLQSASTQQLFHWSSYGLAGLAPVAMILSPSFLNFPVDFALGLVIPVHMHIGLVIVIEDYVPRATQPLARFVLAILSVLTAIGLLKINLCGAGITESVKSVWREPKQLQAGDEHRVKVVRA